MKSRTPKRPIAITILATTMIGLSMMLICDRIFNFYLYRLLESNVPLVGSNSTNLQLVSGMAFLGLGLVPILLAIGLLCLKSWARFLSICFFSSILFPAIGTSLQWISPPSANKLLDSPNVFDDIFSVDVREPVSRLMALEPYLAIGSAIALMILLTPAIGRAFRHHYNHRD